MKPNNRKYVYEQNMFWYLSKYEKIEMDSLSLLFRSLSVLNVWEGQAGQVR